MGRKKNKKIFVVPEHTYRLIIKRQKNKGDARITAKIIETKTDKTIFETSAPTWPILVKNLKKSRYIPENLEIRDRGVTYF